MRVAVLADIHGNIHALDAVLAHLKTLAVDEIVVAGDVVTYSPFSKACWDRVMALSCPIIRGNHERNLTLVGTSEGAHLQEERFKPILAAHAQFDKADIHVMRDLPLTYALPDLLISHATPKDDYVTILETATDEGLHQHFGEWSEHYFLRGHNHRWYTLRWNERTLYSIGSVGLPLDSSRKASYALLEHTLNGWQLEQKSVSYDIETALKSFEDYAKVAGPMADIWRRSLATGGNHPRAFFDRYIERLDAKTITLEHAVTEFLAS